MKILVSTFKGGMDDNICPTFGRCPTFTSVDSDSMEAKVLQNPGSSAGGGAGIAAAQAAMDAGAQKVITGNCGPNALAVLARAGIKVYGSMGAVREAVDALLKGELTEIASPGPLHSGFGRGGGFGPGRGFGGGRP
jgi:predicted Fe-Mo cluster-binding NifX family protein